MIQGARNSHKGRTDPPGSGQKAKDPPTLALWGALRMYDLLIFPAILSFVALGGGEISAVLAIDHRHATRVEHAFVIGSLLVLPIITVIATVASISFTWSKTIADQEDEASP